MFESVRTVAVFATDLERAKRFYTEVLDFVLRVQPSEDLCFLRSRSGKIHLYLEGGHRPAASSADSAHLSFFLETKGPAREAFDRLLAAGVKLLEQSPEEVGDGTFVFRFEDPDGNILEATGGG